jgi:uncharacterized protein YbjT (DUF2867 family)
MTQRIAVAGVTGYIGGRLVPRLLDAGYAVRCLVRSPQKLQDREWVHRPGVEVCTVDLNDPNSLQDHLEACDAAYYLVHSMVAAGSDYSAVDRDLAAHFAKAAKDAGVRRIVYLGGLGETGPHLSKHLSSRREVEEMLGSGGVPVTVFRAAMIIGSGSASFEILRYLVERLPVMITPKWVSTPCQPIGVRNVITYLLGALAVEETTGGVFDIGGPEVMRYSDIMRVMAEELKLPRRWIIPVPVLTPRLSSYWIQFVTPLSHNIGGPLAEGLRNPVVCRDHRILSLIPQSLLTVREAIRAALSKVVGNDIETSWSMAGPIPGDPDWAGGKVYRDTRQIGIDAPADSAFRAVCRVGGGHGWYAADWLWKIRGWMDLLVGGPGLRRGRRHPETVGFGEALDFWRVVGIEHDRRLSLRAEMKLPGEALLEFRLKSLDSEHCVLEQEALFIPRGLFGLLYWYAVVPFHAVVFKGMLNGIRREALQIANTQKKVQPA